MESGSRTGSSDSRADLKVLFSIFIPLAISSLNLFAPMFSNMTMETESVYSLIISITMFFFCVCWESLGLVPSIDSQFHVVFFPPDTRHTAISCEYCVDEQPEDWLTYLVFWDIQLVLHNFNWVAQFTECFSSITLSYFQVTPFSYS